MNVSSKEMAEQRSELCLAVYIMERHQWSTWFPPTDIFFNIKLKKMLATLKTDTDDTGDFQKHDKTDEMKSIWGLGKSLSFIKWCSASLQLKTPQRGMMAHIGSIMRVCLSPTSTTSLWYTNMKVGKANNCQLLYFQISYQHKYTANRTALQAARYDIWTIRIANTYHTRKKKKKNNQKKNHPKSSCS